MIPKWLWLIVISLVLVPYIIYRTLPEDYSWIGTLAGLLIYGIIFPIGMFSHAINKNYPMVSANSPIGKSKNKRLKTTISLLIRILFVVLSMGIFLRDGIYIARDSIYLISNKPSVIQAEILDQSTTLTGWAVALKFLTIQDGENIQQKKLTSLFIYEKYLNGKKYIFTLLPNSKKILKVELIES